MEFVSGNVFIRPNKMEKAGQVVPGHTHNFDHTTIVFKGSVHVKATYPDGTVREGNFKAPSHFLVRADVSHEIMSTRDDTEFWCVYSHHTPQGDVVQEYTGWEASYG